MTELKKQKLRPRVREAVIQSLRAGVTPKTGLQYIQVGRVREIKALLKDVERICSGGCAFRLIIGEFGSGKSFFLQLVRAVALEKGLVTVHADLSPDRRLHATGGQARSLYAELLRNLSTRTKPDGNALTSVVERFITIARKEADAAGCTVQNAMDNRLEDLSELVGGYDFAKVIAAYWHGYEHDNDQMKADAVRWLRGEFSTKTEARKALDVRRIVNDGNIYDHLKLMSLFVRQAGYQGLLVNLDEMVNLYKLSSQKARTSNYEEILRMLNDCLQGSAKHMGFLLGGTPDFLLDPRKGLYSYEALQSRLAENSFARTTGTIDYDAPVLHLANLSPEELYILLQNIRGVFTNGEANQCSVPDEALRAFLAHCSQKIGDAYFRTPRNTVKVFVDMLSVLQQNPQLQWENLVQQAQVTQEVNSDMPPVTTDAQGEGGGDDLAVFRL